jgi:hypothetical protein
MKARFGVFGCKSFLAFLDSLFRTAFVEKLPDWSIKLAFSSNQTTAHAHFKFAIASE